MHYNGCDLVSLNDFVEIMCKPNDVKSTTVSISNEVCTLISSKYSFKGNKCYKAEALDKTRHLLFSLELILEIFMKENIRKTIVESNFMQNLLFIQSKMYTITNSMCCCCPKKLKKGFAHASSFTEFVRQGDVEMRRFNSIKPSIKFLICLDIEGIRLIFIYHYFYMFI